MQPNLRAQPMVMDPFAINEVDFILASHYHSDHIDVGIFKATMISNPKLNHVKFVGPWHCTEMWKNWGVPEDRLITVKPGDVLELKDVKIHALDSFDRTCLVTLPVEGAEDNGGELAGLCPSDEEMGRKAVNYVFETPGGNIYHGAKILIIQFILQNTEKILI